MKENDESYPKRDRFRDEVIEDEIEDQQPEPPNIHIKQWKGHYDNDYALTEDERNRKKK